MNNSFIVSNPEKNQEQYNEFLKGIYEGATSMEKQLNNELFNCFDELYKFKESNEFLNNFYNEIIIAFNNENNSGKKARLSEIVVAYNEFVSEFDKFKKYGTILKKKLSYIEEEENDLSDLRSQIKNLESEYKNSSDMSRKMQIKREIDSVTLDYNELSVNLNNDKKYISDSLNKDLGGKSISGYKESLVGKLDNLKNISRKAFIDEIIDIDTKEYTKIESELNMIFAASISKEFILNEYLEKYGLSLTKKEEEKEEIITEESVEEFQEETPVEEVVETPTEEVQKEPYVPVEMEIIPNLEKEDEDKDKEESTEENKKEPYVPVEIEIIPNPEKEDDGKVEENNSEERPQYKELYCSTEFDESLVDNFPKDKEVFIPIDDPRRNKDTGVVETNTEIVNENVNTLPADIQNELNNNAPEHVGIPVHEVELSEKGEVINEIRENRPEHVKDTRDNIRYKLGTFFGKLDAKIAYTIEKLTDEEYRAERKKARKAARERKIANLLRKFTQDNRAQLGDKTDINLMDNVVGGRTI